MRLPLPVVLFLAVPLLAACSSPQLVGSDQVRVVSSADLPAPTAQDYVPAGLPYLVSPFDKLVIEVLGIPELRREVQADGSGKFSYPLIGEVDASAKTTDEVAAIITTGLRANYVRNPQVSVNLTEAVGQTVAVDGQVTRPGVYPVRNRMTLMRAVASAGGATELAQQYVVVFRRVGEQDMATLYSLAAIRQGLYGDPQIYPNDVVYVGQSTARRLFRDFIQASGLIASPIAVLLQ